MNFSIARYNAVERDRNGEKCILLIYFPSVTSRSRRIERVARNGRLDYNRGIILPWAIFLRLSDNCKWRPFMPQGRLIKAADK